MTIKKPRNPAKASTTGGAIGILASYAGFLAAQRLHLPIEVASAGVGIVGALVARWAAKLDPHV